MFRALLILCYSLFFSSYFQPDTYAKPHSRYTSVKVVKTRQGGYRLLVNKKLFLVKGVTYNPIPPGYNYSYDFWSDLSAIEQDAERIKEGGYNTIRFYAPGDDLEKVKKVIQIFHKKGIYTIMGHWLGFWNYPCPFYGDAGFRKQVKAKVLDMVEALKNEKGLLMWVLGNENNYSFSGKVNPWPCNEVDGIEDPSGKVAKKAEVYYKFINNLAGSIKRIDKRHPVALGNGEMIALDIAARYAPKVDLLGLIFYRGKRFGNIFNSVKRIFDKPVLITEMGCDAFNAFRNREDQSIQAEFLLSQWIDLYKNTVFSSNKSANCLGGVIFEWNDEWWKHRPEDSTYWVYHDTMGGWGNGSYYFDIKAPRNLNMNEEWFGLVAFRKDTNGGYIKKPRKAYYVLREFFSCPGKFLENKK